MVALTATVNTTYWGVRLEATGTAGTVEFYRTRAGGDTYLGSATGDPAVVVDYGPELGVSYDYYASDDTDTDVVTGVRVDSDFPILASTVSALAIPVTVVDFRPYTAEARSVWHPVLGRNDPLVTIHPMVFPKGMVRFYAATNNDRIKLLDMLYGGEPMHLRSIDFDRLDSFHFLAESWSDPFVTDGQREGQSYIEVEFQAVGRVPGIVPPDPDRTYSTVLDAHGTYQDVLITWGTYRQLLDG